MYRGLSRLLYLANVQVFTFYLLVLEIIRLRAIIFPCNLLLKQQVENGSTEVRLCRWI